MIIDLKEFKNMSHEFDDDFIYVNNVSYKRYIEFNEEVGYLIGNYFFNLHCKIFYKYTNKKTLNRNIRQIKQGVNIIKNTILQPYRFQNILNFLLAFAFSGFFIVLFIY